MLQTRVTNDNQKEFYNSVYLMHTDSREQLINLDLFDSACIVIDCCGWHYKTLFQQSNIIAVETIKSAKEYGFTKDQFDYLIINLGEQFVWPNIDAPAPVLIFDRSPLLKYLTISDLSDFVSVAGEKYCAKQIVIKHQLTFVDDPRIVDRFYNFNNFKIKNYCVEKFSYNAQNEEYFIQLKRIVNIE